MFTFEACDGYLHPSSEPVAGRFSSFLHRPMFLLIAGFILAPKPFHARAVPRN